MKDWLIKFILVLIVIILFIPTFGTVLVVFYFTFPIFMSERKSEKIIRGSEDKYKIVYDIIKDANDIYSDRTIINYYPSFVNYTLPKMYSHTIDVPGWRTTVRGTLRRAKGILGKKGIKKIKKIVDDINGSIYDNITDTRKELKFPGKIMTEKYVLDKYDGNKSKIIYTVASIYFIYNVISMLTYLTYIMIFHEHYASVLGMSKSYRRYTDHIFEARINGLDVDEAIIFARDRIFKWLDAAELYIKSSKTIVLLTKDFYGNMRFPRIKIGIGNEAARRIIHNTRKRYSDDRVVNVGHRFYKIHKKPKKGELFSKKIIEVFKLNPQ